MTETKKFKAARSDFNGRDRQVRTPLMLAGYRGHHEIAQALIKAAGAKP